MKSYDYSQRKGVEEISWERFACLAATLAEGNALEEIEVVVGIARAGLFPATAVGCALCKELFPVRITRRKLAFMKMWQQKVPLVEKEVQMPYDEFKELV